MGERGRDDMTKGLPSSQKGASRNDVEATRRIGGTSPTSPAGGRPVATAGPEPPAFRTAPRGGTLMANLDSKSIPAPIELRAVTGQHEIPSTIRRVEGRYVLGQELGRGGMGLVRLVKDLDIGRHVAMKTLNPDDPDRASLIEPLITEAQTTGQLEHPNIIPVYELGVLPSNEVFYTMKAVSGLTLKDVLHKLRAGDSEAEEEYTLRRLLTIFGQMCLAMHYAHSSGVVHRDLKPDNVLLGSYGEVLVMDWGIAYVVGRTEQALARPGMVVGTPHYMAPEQARGEIHLITGLTDVFSLGVILYEILTLSTPIKSSDTDRALEEVRAMTLPKRPMRSVHGAAVPDVLADVCVQAMQPLPEDRISTCRILFDMIEAYLEGSAERERRQRMAADALAVGVQALGRYMELRRTRDKLARRMERRTQRVHRWDAAAAKRDLWDLRARYDNMELMVSQAFSASVNHFHRVIGLVPDQAQARAALANMYWARFEEAEESGDYPSMMYFADLVLKFNDAERGGPLSGGCAVVTVRSFPEGAELTLFDFAQGVPDIRMAAGQPLGSVPVAQVELAMGMYLVVAHKDGYRDAHMPIFVRPGVPRIYLLTLKPWTADERLVGRAGELDVMRLNLHRAVEGRQVRRLLVSGADGMGKHRLLSEFTEYVEGLPETVLFFFAECHEAHALVPYGAITEALRIRAGVRPDDGVAAVEDKLITMISATLGVGGPPAQHDRELAARTARVLSRLPGMANGDLAPELPPRQMRERFDLALVDFMKLMTRWEPALFYFQEVEYLDDASARVLRKAPEFLDDSPVLFIGFGSDISMHTGWEERLRLGPLSETAVDALLRDLLKGPLPTGLHEYVMARSGGTPWLVVDTVRRLAESYALYYSDGAWYLKDGQPIPPRESMLESRRAMVVDLPERLARVLEWAAVIGDVFWSEALVALGVPDVESCCAELMEREFIRSKPSSRYQGTHAYAFAACSSARSCTTTSTTRTGWQTCTARSRTGCVSGSWATSARSQSSRGTWSWRATRTGPPCSTASWAMRVGTAAAWGSPASATCGP